MTRSSVDNTRADIAKVANQSPFFAKIIESTNGPSLFDVNYLDQARPTLSFNHSASPEGFDQQLRETRQKEMARIIFRDQTRRADLVETTRDLSLLADSSLENALQYHHKNLCEEWGEPLNSKGEVQNLSILALGKLGAYELNLSSDIDLIFFYDEQGTLEKSGRSYQEFFLKLARKLIASIDSATAKGFVFRVDMRLRPYGDSGALVMHRASMEKYFVEQGRDWERYAFIKARAAAGDIKSGEDFLLWLQPFIFRKHIDYGALESLRDMKQLINKEVVKRSLQDDVKLGDGGIREVEFIVQSQQLIWGGKRPELRQRRLLEMLDVLQKGEYLPDGMTHELRAAYIFLRNTEHAIQAENDQQTQQLPMGSASQLRVSNALGYDDYDAFLMVLNEHRDKVSLAFSGLMNANDAEREDLLEGNLYWRRIWESPDSEESIHQLGVSGYGNAIEVAKSTYNLKVEFDSAQQLALERLTKLMPLVLQLCSRELTPDETFRAVVKLIESVRRRSTYLAFLNENLDALQRVVRLCSVSASVAEQLSKYPILLYELTDKELDEGVESTDSLEAQLDESLSALSVTDLEGWMDALRTFKHAASLKIAALELLGELPTMKASDQLTFIAEIILDRSVKIARRYLIERHGFPSDLSGEKAEIEFGIIAYGKLGGFELGYGSDLDLVFVHSGNRNGHTLGERSIHNSVFYQRLGQRVVHILTAMTRFGSLYEIDLRLRPDGNSGALVPPISSYEKYIHESAWTWEQQALVRARFVAGPTSLKQTFDAIRANVLQLERNAVTLSTEVVGMREKMRSQGKGSKANAPEEVLLSGFDLKQDAGALIDIEFLVQFLVLLGANRYPSLSRWTDKVRILDCLEQEQLVTAQECELLQRAYVSYRAAVHFDWLGSEPAVKNQLDSIRDQVIQIWRHHLVEPYV